MNYKVAEVATDWWIEQIKKQCKDLYPNKVTAENSNLVIIDDSLKEELSRFEKILAEKILNCIEKNIYISFTCCYFPNYELKVLARMASISTTYFPVRAEMYVGGSSVKVSLDGNPLRPLPFPAE